ncbi:hypothetical protein B566_EDAN004259 [Ephemera danica]|nr:hypothetical protein B566_EDAN004259 [Ephemera danica]
MASPRTRRVLQDLKTKDSNGCSGKHRGLGVHLSFVRSISMDKWKDVELEKMKIATLAQGLEWDESKSPGQNFVSSRVNSSSTASSGTTDFYNSYQDDPGTGYQSGGGAALDLPPSQGGRYGGFGYTMDPPPRSTSQEFFDTAVSSLASGWSIFSSSATKVASKATEGAIKIGSVATQKVTEISATVGEKVKEGKLLEDMGTQVTSLATKVGDLGKKGWGTLAGQVLSPSSEQPHQSFPGSPQEQRSPRTERSSLLDQQLGGESLTRKYEEEVGWETWDSPNATPKATKLPATKSGNTNKNHANGGQLLDFNGQNTKKQSTAQPANNQDWSSKWEDEAWEELNK